MGANDVARFNFGPAAPDLAAPTVYGARRPGYRLFPPADDGVEDWVEAMRDRGIERVVCLLDDALDDYGDLLGSYRSAFGADAVLHAPVTDHTPFDVARFEDDVLPFLRAADRADERTVVHCSAGVGRTGQVLVGWLCRARGFPLDGALSAVRSGTDAVRRPMEAADTDRAHLRRLCGIGGGTP